MFHTQKVPVIIQNQCTILCTIPTRVAKTPLDQIDISSVLHVDFNAPGASFSHKTTRIQVLLCQLVCQLAGKDSKYPADRTKALRTDASFLET